MKVTMNTKQYAYLPFISHKQYIDVRCKIYERSKSTILSIPNQQRMWKISFHKSLGCRTSS